MTLPLNTGCWLGLRVFIKEDHGQLPPSCPSYWMMPSSPQEIRWASQMRSDPWEPLSPRRRSRSLNSADIRRLHSRTARLRMLDLGDKDGYSEDDEGSSTDDGISRYERKERSSSCTSKDTLSRFRELHGEHSVQAYRQVPPRSQARPLSASSGRRKPLLEKSLHASPPSAGGRHCRKKQTAQGSMNKTYAASSMQSVCCSPLRPQQPRPFSAGSAKNRRQKSCCQLSARMKESYLGAVTTKGYPLRTAILALQKTGCRSPNEILSYLGAIINLCELGYDEAQVEEALEMFQNCDGKVAEFLRLLTQFREMGFQQSAIKEVLLVHENHREKALEELMTHTD